jgi:hypothetical protein
VKIVWCLVMAQVMARLMLLTHSFSSSVNKPLMNLYKDFLQGGIEIYMHKNGLHTILVHLHPRLAAESRGVEKGYKPDQHGSAGSCSVHGLSVDQCLSDCSR